MFYPLDSGFAISDDASVPIIFCFDQQFLTNLFAQAVIRSTLQRLENDFTIISKGAFRFLWTSMLYLLDSFIANRDRHDNSCI